MSIKGILLFVMLLSFYGISYAEELVILTASTGGEAILLSSVNGEFTILGDIIFKETGAGQIAINESDMRILLPTGFSFDTSSSINISVVNTKLDESGNCAGAGNKTLRLGTSSSGSLSINVVPEESSFTFHIKQASAGNCKGTLTISGLKVRLENFETVSGDITFSGVSIEGLEAESTSLGRLEVIDDIPEDTTAPIITLIGEAVLEVEVNTFFEDPGVTVSDNVDEALEVQIDGQVDIHQLGEYILSYGAIDSSGNEAVIVTRTVQVVDTTAPVITLIGDGEVELFVGDTFVDLGATAEDNFDEQISISSSGAVNSSEVGVYEIVYEAIDVSGNKAQQKRMVNIKSKHNSSPDPTPPITSPEPIKKSIQSGSKSSYKTVLQMTPKNTIPQTPKVLGATTVDLCLVTSFETLTSDQILSVQEELNKKLILALEVSGVFDEVTAEAVSIFKIAFCR